MPTIGQHKEILDIYPMLCYSIDMRQTDTKEATMNQIIKEVRDSENGVSAIVSHIEKGYSVTLRDDDSGEFIGTWKIFSDEAKAFSYADSLVH